MPAKTAEPPATPALEPLTAALVALVDADPRNDTQLARDAKILPQRLADMRAGRRVAVLDLLVPLARELKVRPADLGRLVYLYDASKKPNAQ